MYAITEHVSACEVQNLRKRFSVNVSVLDLDLYNHHVNEFAVLIGRHNKHVLFERLLKPIKYALKHYTYNGERIHNLRKQYRKCRICDQDFTM